LVLWTLNALDLKGRSSSKLSLGWTPGHVLVHYPLHFRRQRRGRLCSVSLRKATAFTEPRRWPTPALAPLCCDVLSTCHVAGHLHVPPRCACDTSRILCFRGTPCASDTATPVALGLTAPMSLAALHRLSHSIRPLPMGAGHGSLPGLVSAKERNSLSAVGEFTTPAAQPYLTTTLN
jgi:hypothetical protein